MMKSIQTDQLFNKFIKIWHNCEPYISQNNSNSISELIQTNFNRKWPPRLGEHALRHSSTPRVFVWCRHHKYGCLLTQASIFGCLLTNILEKNVLLESSEMNKKIDFNTKLSKKNSHHFSQRKLSMGDFFCVRRG